MGWILTRHLDGSTRRDGRLFPATTVVIGSSGVSVARLVPAPPWEANPAKATPVGLDELSFLAELGRTGDVDEDPSPSSPLDPERADALLATLREHGLWRPSSGAPDLDTDAPIPSGPPTDPEADAGTAGGDGPIVLLLPVVVRIGPGRFEAVDHDGRIVATLTAAELWSAAVLTVPRTLEEAIVAQREQAPGHDLSDQGFRALVARLRRAGLVIDHDPAVAALNPTADDHMRKAIRAEFEFVNHANEVHAAHDIVERRRVQATGQRRVKLVPVQVAGNIPPLSTGMVLAHARAHEGGRLEEHYDFHPRWIVRSTDAPGEPGEPVVFLFTNYLWSHERNLDFAAEVKARNPAAITIHGGPDCPSYPGESEAYLRANPQVDIAVRGEGEETAAQLLAALGPSLQAGSPDLSVLADVAGLVYRQGEEIVRTADRPRMEDVDLIPSPYLTGVFDCFGDTRQLNMAIIETNRGCPYGCTFCDWGSATNSRIRKFDLDRVLAEFEWCAQHAVPRIFIADANFGIFARDVDIARHVVDLRARYGYPQRFITNYAKNTVKHLKEIVSTLAEGGVLSEGLMSLQSMDADTLTTIRRSNIKLEKYEALSKEFRHASLPLFVDLMMGLPGQTLGSLRSDLQQCVDREVNAKCHQTELLVNSPMNDPEYRTEHRLEMSRPPGATGKGAAKALELGPAFVVSSATFTRDDYDEMHRMRRSYLLAENFGVLRQVSRFVRRESGVAEVDLVEGMRLAATADPDRWPYLALTLLSVPDSMVPPVSWARFIDEVRSYLVEVIGLAEGADLDTVLAVQHALLPTPGRRFPLELELEHDYAAWYATVLDAKDDGHLHDWDEVVAPLRTFGPAVLRVDDPRELCTHNIGFGSAIEAYQDWELASPVARAMPGHYRIE